MRFKLDENLDLRLAPLLAEGGHDVETVLREGLSGRSDETVYQVCLKEGRTLVTLDLDFANPMRFPPGPSEGMVVVRPPRPVLGMICSTLTGALGQLKTGRVKGMLWIVEPGRIRVYQPGEEDENSTQNSGV
jgi:hypothetical protein